MILVPLLNPKFASVFAADLRDDPDLLVILPPSAYRNSIGRRTGGHLLPVTSRNDISLSFSDRPNP